jgi:hypothetical protein
LLQGALRGILADSSPLRQVRTEQPTEKPMAKQSDKDPERLAQVQQSDLGESRVNEEFVDWLKKWGNSILLAILLVALIGVGWNWLQRKIDTDRDTAWTNLSSAQLPASLEEVAAESKDIDSVSTLALLGAADQYLTSIQNNTPIGGVLEGEEPGLDDATRTEYLKNADALYSQALASVGDLGKNFSMKILACSALFGQAAVAESQGNIDQARVTLTKILETANPEYPDLAEQATFRISTLEPLATRLVLPNEADLPTPPEPEAIPDPLELLRGQLNLESAGTTAPANNETTQDSGDASALILEGAPTTTPPATAEPATTPPATTPPATTPPATTPPATTPPATTPPATTPPATTPPATTEPAAEPSGDGG